MTCIVGLVEDGEVYLGGDSAAVADWDLMLVKQSKVFRNGSYILGYTHSFRAGQLLQHMELPEILTEDLFKFMTTTFIDVVRSGLSRGGYAKRENEREEGWQFLVGVSGRLFEVDSDYSITESLLNFEAIGSGAAVARGALYLAQNYDIGTRPVEKIRRALEAAECLNASVRRPFTIVSSSVSI